MTEPVISREQFNRGRLRFLDEHGRAFSSGGSPFPSAIIVYNGGQGVPRVAACDRLGNPMPPTS